MLACVANESFKRHRKVNNGRHFFVFPIHRGELFRIFQRLLKRHADLERHELGNSINKSIRLAQYTAGVTDDSFGRHRAEGDNLRDTLPAIALCDVVDDAITALHAEIDVEVRHRDTFRIQEALKQKNMLQRIEVRNAENPGDQRARA